MYKAAFTAVGCKLNQYETQAMAESLEAHGVVQVPFDDPADVYVINSCTVTSRADFSSRQLIRQALRRAPNARIIVTGCYADLNGPALSEGSWRQGLGHISRLVSNKNKSQVPQIILDLLGIESTEPVVKGFSISKMNGHSRAFVKIQDGCAEKCTYCIIWKARGIPTSRDPLQVIAEINRLYDNDYREIVLTGVHIGRYKNALDLAGLLELILKETQMPRIRLSSLKPNEFNDRILDIISANHRICPHFHVPIQSGDDAILKLMGRKYDSNSVVNTINHLVQARPDSTIGADFIVGFPGETNSQFERSLGMVEANPIHHLHVFTYSVRQGTPASDFPGKVEPAEKSKRRRLLQQAGYSAKSNQLKKFIGKTMSVIVEQQTAPGKYEGLTANFLKVDFSGAYGLSGRLVNLKINSCDKDKLSGELIGAS